MKKILSAPPKRTGSLLPLVAAWAVFSTSPPAANGGTPADELSLVPAAVEPVDDWYTNLTLTVWTVNMNGVMGADGLVVPVDVSFQDILDSLNFVAAGLLDVRKEGSRFGLIAAGSYIELGPDIGPVRLPAGTINGITVKQVMASAALYYRVADWDRGYFDVLGGAGYMYMSNTLEFSGGRSAGGSASWVDPYVGVRGKHYLTERFYLEGVADIGGFGAGSELTWNAGGGVGYHLTDQIAMDFFYRYMSVDYNDDILFDVDMSGLFLGMSFDF